MFYGGNDLVFEVVGRWSKMEMEKVFSNLGVYW